MNQKSITRIWQPRKRAQESAYWPRGGSRSQWPRATKECDLSSGGILMKPPILCARSRASRHGRDGKNGQRRPNGSGKVRSFATPAQEGGQFDSLAIAPSQTPQISAISPACLASPAHSFLLAVGSDPASCGKNQRFHFSFSSDFTQQ